MFREVEFVELDEFGLRINSGLLLGHDDELHVEVLGLVLAFEFV